jgi:hypothetical protein
VGSNPTLSAIFLVPAKQQYHRLLATVFEDLAGGCIASVYARFRGSDGWEYQKSAIRNPRGDRARRNFYNCILG